MGLRIFDRDTLQEIGQSIRRNKRRSIATAFGVFWGLFILVVLLSISRGFENGIGGKLSSVSPRSIAIWPGQTSEPYAGFKAGRLIRLRKDDITYLMSRCPEIRAVGYMRYSRKGGDKNLRYENKTTQGNVVGVNKDYFDINQVKLVAGRMLNLADHKEVRKSCLLGEEVARKLFGDDVRSAIGRSVSLNGRSYQLIGVVKPASAMVNIGTWVPTSAFLPIAVLEQSENTGGSVSGMYLDLHRSVAPAVARKHIESVLKERMMVAPEDDTAMMFFVVEELVAIFESIMLGINILVWIVGIGTLLTAIVGVSNIMLVTVRERTQEIGVRRALGAKPSDIISQILAESVFLTFISGLLGILLGVGLMAVVGEVTSSVNATGDGGMPFENPTISPSLLVFALFIVVLGGLLAGALPATRALAIKAIDAIREE